MHSRVFSLIEYTGEQPNRFDRLLNDVAVYSIARNIAVDLKEMIGHRDVPERLQPVENVLF
jgi:putative membrane protein